jgi:Holliday junction resolvase RusA-like endonuclease
VEGRVKLLVAVDGPIVPTARPRIVHGRASNPRTTVEYKSKIARATKAAVAAQGWTHVGVVTIEIVAFAPPKGADVDNIAKSALDGLVAGGAIKDDNWRIVCSLSVLAFDRGEPGIRIAVTSVGASCS